MENLKLKLEDIIKEYPTSIKAVVAKEAIKYYNDEGITLFFDDLLLDGCVSGMVTSLVDYNDIHKFYDKHYNEIEKFRKNNVRTNNCTMGYNRDLKTFLAWTAFEEIAKELMNEFGI